MKLQQTSTLFHQSPLERNLRISAPSRRVCKKPCVPTGCASCFSLEGDGRGCPDVSNSLPASLDGDTGSVRVLRLNPFQSVENLGGCRYLRILKGSVAVRADRAPPDSDSKKAGIGVASENSERSIDRIGAGFPCGPASRRPDARSYSINRGGGLDSIAATSAKSCGLPTARLFISKSEVIAELHAVPDGSGPFWLSGYPGRLSKKRKADVTPRPLGMILPGRGGGGRFSIGNAAYSRYAGYFTFHGWGFGRPIKMSHHPPASVKSLGASLSLRSASGKTTPPLNVGMTSR